MKIKWYLLQILKIFKPVHRKIFILAIFTLLASPSLGQQRPEHPSIRLLKQYFNAVINQGDSGSRFWCSNKRDLETSFFSPTAYRILSANVSQNGIGRYFVVRVNSSNRSGQPVVQNWMMAVDKEPNARLARNFPGGYCLGLVTEN